MQDVICGTATVGERGQIVIPVDVRKKFDINAGDKIWILGSPSTQGIILLKSNDLQGLLLEFVTNLMNEESHDTLSGVKRSD